MGSLRDQLKKAGLLSEKEARRLAHQQRVEHSTKGREALEAEEARRRQELEQLAREQRERTKSAQARLDAEREAAARRAMLGELLRSRAFKDWAGPRRFHFVTRSGAVPFLSVDPGVARRLEAGELAIVEEPASRPERFLLVDRATAQRAAQADAEAVRFLAGAPPPARP